MLPFDASTVCAETMTMAQRVSKSKSNVFFVDENCHPRNIAVIRTRAKPLSINLVIDTQENLKVGEVFGAIFQYLGTYGLVHDFTDIIAALKKARMLSDWSISP